MLAVKQIASSAVHYCNDGAKGPITHLRLHTVCVYMVV